MVTDREQARKKLRRQFLESLPFVERLEDGAFYLPPCAGYTGHTGRHQLQQRRPCGNLGKWRFRPCGNSSARWGVYCEIHLMKEIRSDRVELERWEKYADKFEIDAETYKGKNRKGGTS